LTADGWPARQPALCWSGPGLLTRDRCPDAAHPADRGRTNRYLETSLLPGRAFTGPDDFNTQLTERLQIANRRVHHSVQARLAERWETDRVGMLRLPLMDPPQW
jgi:hypothetical protein